MLSGQCLAWSYWAPLVVFVVSFLPLWLAFHADRWQERPVRRLVDAARWIATLTTIGFFMTAIIVAVVDAGKCRV